MADEQYDKEQLRILRNAFKAFDNDERGFIEHADVHSILEILGQKLDEKAIKALIKEVDKDNTGKLDFNQFCRLGSRFVEVEEDTTNLLEELKEAFRVYDKEGKGYLTTATLRAILHELDDKLTNQDLDMIIEEIDADGSGTVDFDEFMTVMTGKNFYDLTFQRRFVFEQPSCCSRSPFCVNWPSRRLNLHRRIEWHFERFFQQFLQNPFDFDRDRECESVKKFHSLSCETSRPSSTSVKTLRRFFEPEEELKKSFVSLIKKCYRPVFRPRFPKWIPILTLYREIVQNPFKCRGHYMITHHH